MSEAAEQDVQDPRIPLCFDTNAVYDKNVVRRDLAKIRAKFPARKLLLPSIVVAEKARQLRRDYLERFNWQMIRNLLDDPQLRLEVVAFARDTIVPSERAADGNASPWLQVVGDFDDATWEKTERSRFADHAVYAIARHTGAILVTNERELRRQAARDAYRPGAVRMDVLLRACD